MLLRTAAETPFFHLAKTVEVRFATRGGSSGVGLQVPCRAVSGATAMAGAHPRAAIPRGRLCVRTRRHCFCIPPCFPQSTALKQPGESIRWPTVIRAASVVEKVRGIKSARRLNGEDRGRRKHHAGTDTEGICTGTRGLSRRKCRAPRLPPSASLAAWENFQEEGATQPLLEKLEKSTEARPPLPKTAGWHGSPRDQRRHPSGRREEAAETAPVEFPRTVPASLQGKCRTQPARRRGDHRRTRWTCSPRAATWRQNLLQSGELRQSRRGVAGARGARTGLRDKKHGERVRCTEGFHQTGQRRARRG